MSDPRQPNEFDELALLALKERTAHFMSGFYAGVGATFLLFRLAAPAQLHLVLNLIMCISFGLSVAMWKLRAHHKRRIAETAKKLAQSEQGENNG